MPESLSEAQGVMSGIKDFVEEQLNQVEGIRDSINTCIGQLDGVSEFMSKHVEMLVKNSKPAHLPMAVQLDLEVNRNRFETMVALLETYLESGSYAIPALEEVSDQIANCQTE